MKKIITMFLVVVAMALLPAPLFADEKLSSKKITLKVGAKKQLYVNNVTTSVTVKWKSSKPAVAAVKNGLVTAKKKGTAKITATVNKRKLTCNVTVTAKAASADKGEYQIGDTWKVPGQWTVKVTGVEKTSERNEYAETNPKAVYIVTFVWKNLGYTSSYGDLFLVMDGKIVDAKGSMGYSYPGDVTYYPQETPVGATCKGQVCIGVDHPGDFKLFVESYDSKEVLRKATFNVKVN